MAMLAEPRQRKRYNLVPRGKALYEDDSRFGTKMLEKMGWSKGKGLGAKEDGAQDFVRVRYKNDDQGLGYEQRDDQWTQHENSFNGLLKTLNGEENGDANVTSKESNDFEDEMPRIGFGFQDTSVKEDSKKKNKTLKEKISGISLEEKSKQSKARVHYKKFTKGKDLAQYSEKDLANIFGKKAANEQETAVNDFYQQLNNNFKQKEEEPKVEKKEEGSIEKLSGVQIFSSNISVADYFKMKMEAMKNRKNGIHNDENKREEEIVTEFKDEQISKKKKKKKKDQNSETENVVYEEEETLNKSKKSKKFEVKELGAEDIVNEEMELSNKKKKSKKRKVEEVVEYTEEVVDAAESKKSKKPKVNQSGVDNTVYEEQEQPLKKKSKKGDVMEINITTEDVNVATVSKKEKKSKKKYKNDALEQEQKVEEITEEKQSTKKRKNYSNESTTPQECLPEIDLTEEPLKKKKKKTKTLDSLEIIEIEDDIVENEINLEDPAIINEKKKKKKKTKANLESNESSEKEENQTISSNNVTQKSTKSKNKDVSSTTTQPLTNDVKNKLLTLAQIKNKYSKFNIYQISSFCAEKFRNINLNHFTGSTLPQVEGYGLNEDIKLDVIMNKTDEQRITDMWKSTLDKYDRLVKPKKTYSHYVNDVFKARKAKQKMPKLSVKTWKRRNAFQII